MEAWTRRYELEMCLRVHLDDVLNVYVHPEVLVCHSHQSSNSPASGQGRGRTAPPVGEDSESLCHRSRAEIHGTTERAQDMLYRAGSRRLRLLFVPPAPRSRAMDGCDSSGKAKDSAMAPGGKRRA